MADLSKLSTDDLLALKTGDLSKISTEGLLVLKGGSPAALPAQPETSLGGVAGEIGKGALRGVSALAKTLVRGSPVEKQGFISPFEGMMRATPATGAERFAGTTGEILSASALTGGVGSIPRAVITGLSALGGATGEQLGGEAGQAAGTILPGIVQPVSHGAKILATKLYPTAGSIGARAAGDKTRAVIDALRTEQSNVPGVNLTAGQASIPANSAEFAALQRRVAQEQAPSVYFGPGGREGQQQTAVRAAVQGIGKTPQDLARAITERGAISTANYGRAFQQAIKADPELAKLASNPYFKDEIPEALKLTRGRGIDPKTNLTEFLQYVKEGLDAKLQSLTSVTPPAISNATKAAILDVKNQLVNWLSRANPSYDVARATHAALSGPINQMRVGQELERALVAPATEMQRVAGFGGALRKAETTISKGSGKPRIEDLTPQQRATIAAIEEQFKRDATFERLASKGMKSLETRIGAPEVPPTGLFWPLASAARSWVNRLLGTGLEQGLQRTAKKMVNPQAMAQAMEHYLQGVPGIKASDPLYRAALAAALYEGQQP